MSKEYSDGALSDDTLATDKKGNTHADASLKHVYKQEVTNLRWVVSCIALYTGALLYGLDTTIAATVQASIYEDFGHISKLPWVGIGFPLGSVATILFIGKLYSRFSSKWLSLVSLVIFEVGSAVCGAAPNFDALIVGRVIAGIGGAGMYLGALNYFAAFTDKKKRPLYNALIGLSWGIGAIIGPAIGGAFSDSSASWRWGFYINLPIAAFVIPSAIFIFPQYNPDISTPLSAKLKTLDWLGALLNAATLTLFILVLNFQGSTWAWNAPGSIVLWVLFGLSLLAFILQQRFTVFTSTETRIFPAEFLKSKSMIIVFVASCCAAAAMTVALFYTPIFYQFTKGDSALKASVRLLPYIIPFVFFVMFTGALLPVVRLYAPFYLVSGALIVIGGALSINISPTTHTAALYGFNLLIAVGVGTSYQLGYAIVAAKLPQHKAAIGIGFINVAQLGSIAISLAIAGSIFQNKGFVNLKHDLAGFNFTDTDLRLTLAGAASAVLQHGNVEAQHIALYAIVKTIATSYALVISAGALMFVCACLMPWEKLNLEMTAGG